MFIFIFLFLISGSFADSFHRWGTIEADMQKLVDENPTHARIETAGTSIEGRTIKVLVLGESATNPAFLVVGGMHARERIGYELPFRMAQKILSLAKTDEKVRALLSKKSLYVLPMMNPDGVEYDHSGSGKLSWRKNRRPLGEGAIGVDLNRNFSFGWGNEGASSSPFSDIFKGNAPFSEPETRAVRDFVSSHSSIRLIVNYHSFGEQVFYPWGSRYSQIADASALTQHKKLAEGYARLTGYSDMQASAPGLVTGDICDWSFGEMKIPCLGIELDPKEHLNYGHYLPVEEINNVVERNWEAFLFLLSES